MLLKREMQIPNCHVCSHRDRCSPRTFSLILSGGGELLKWNGENRGRHVPGLFGAVNGRQSEYPGRVILFRCATRHNRRSEGGAMALKATEESELKGYKED